MFSKKPFEADHKLVSQATQSVDQAVKSTRRAADEAVHDLVGSVKDLRHEAAPLVNRAADYASSVAQHGVDAVRDSSKQLRKKAQRASRRAVNYIEDEPVKAVLIAAVAGAVLMGMLSLISRPRNRH